MIFDYENVARLNKLFLPEKHSNQKLLDHSILHLILKFYSDKVITLRHNTVVLQDYNHSQIDEISKYGSKIFLKFLFVLQTS